MYESIEELVKNNLHLEMLKVYQQYPPTMKVEINPGYFWSNTVNLVTFDGGETPEINKPPSDSWYVLVSLNENGVIHLDYSDPGDNPVIPIGHYRYLPLAAILVHNDTTEITDDDITDLRPIFGSTTFAFPHNFLTQRDDPNCHSIDSVFGLRDELNNLRSNIILTSPNGTKYRLKVADDGTLYTEPV